LEHNKSVFEHFADNGYKIVGAGKLFHNNHGVKTIFDRKDGRGDFGPGMNYGPFAWKGENNKRDTRFYEETVAHPSVCSEFGVTGFSSFGSLANIPDVPANKATGFKGYTGWRLSSGAFKYINDKERDLMPDELSVQYAIDKLNEEHNSPFFMTIGLIRPHT